MAANNAKVVSKKLKMTITSPPVFEDNSTLDDATAEKVYTHKFTMTGTNTITLSLTSGRLPKGLTFSGKKLSGTPRETGNFNFTITARNSTGSTEQDFTLNVNVAAPKISGLLKNGIVGQSYRSALKASGTTPINWNLNGVLPRGITFSDGVFSGTPTEAFGDYISGGTYTKTLRLIVRGPANRANDRAPRKFTRLLCRSLKSTLQLLCANFLRLALMRQECMILMSCLAMMSAKEQN